MNYALTVKAGDNSQINFGAQKSSVLEAAETEVDTGNQSPMMALIGGGLIFAAA